MKAFLYNDKFEGALIMKGACPFTKICFKVSNNSISKCCTKPFFCYECTEFCSVLKRTFQESSCQMDNRYKKLVKDEEVLFSLFTYVDFLSSSLAVKVSCQNNEFKVEILGDFKETLGKLFGRGRDEFWLKVGFQSVSISNAKTGEHEDLEDTETDSEYKIYLNLTLNICRAN